MLGAQYLSTAPRKARMRLLVAMLQARLQLWDSGSTSGKYAWKSENINVAITATYDQETVDRTARGSKVSSILNGSILIRICMNQSPEIEKRRKKVTVGIMASLSPCSRPLWPSASSAYSVECRYSPVISDRLYFDF